MESTTKKKCFIITPIGDDTDPIRRHIEGIIDAAITPALGDEFDIIVAHRMAKSGSITKQIINEINQADLVIANLTDRNPNVMYELAIRHCLGTPTIMIAEKKTQLPSDIISERTIFYHNDAKGVLELTEELKTRIKEIDYATKNSIVYDVLGDVIQSEEIVKRVAENNVNDGNMLEMIFKRLDSLETSIQEKENTVIFRNLMPIDNEKENNKLVNAYYKRKLREEFEKPNIEPCKRTPYYPK